MKILMTNSRNTNLLAPSYAHYMRELPGVEVESLYHPDEFDQYYNRSLLNKIIFRLYPALCLDKINDGIKKKIDEFRPDLLWIFKGMEIYPSTLEYARQKGARLANYNPDHPFEYEFRGSGNQYVKDSLELYDLHLSYSRYIIGQLKQRLDKPTAWLPFGFNLDEEAYAKLQGAPEEKKICFVGYADAARNEAVTRLAEAGLPVDVYGPGWSNFVKSDSSITVHQPIQGMQFWSTLRRYRVQLNVFRKHNKDSHNMRSFEIPAAGGLMLGPWSTEHAEFFEEGKEAFYYKDYEEMIEKARYMLAMDDGLTQGLRANARNRSVNSGYSYKNRAAFAVDIFRKLN